MLFFLCPMILMENGCFHFLYSKKKRFQVGYTYSLNLIVFTCMPVWATEFREKGSFTWKKQIWTWSPKYANPSLFSNRMKFIFVKSNNRNVGLLLTLFLTKRAILFTFWVSDSSLKHESLFWETSCKNSQCTLNKHAENLNLYSEKIAGPQYSFVVLS